jgi:hypothetical protein
LNRPNFRFYRWIIFDEFFAWFGGRLFADIFIACQILIKNNPFLSQFEGLDCTKCHMYILALRQWHLFAQVKILLPSSPRKGQARQVFILLAYMAAWR